METTPRLAIRVGIFFTIAVLLVMGMSLQVGKSALFDQTYEIEARFEQTFGIDRGTKVALRGVDIGVVRGMEWDAENYDVVVRMEIQDQYKIPANAVAKSQVSSLLGGNFINISVPEKKDGVPNLQPGEVVQTEETASMDEVMTTFNNLSEDARTMIANLDENQEETLQKINEVIEENREDLRDTSRSFSEVGPRLEELSDRLLAITASLNEGEGTLGALYKDKALYNDLKDFSKTANEIGDQVKSGEGDLGQLIYEDRLTVEARQAMGELRSAASDMRDVLEENRGGIQETLASLSDVGPRLEKAASNLNDITDRINRGDGTLGMLVNDPSLYEDIQKAMNQVGESFESSEEQGAFRSFFGLVFGALI